MSVHHKVLTPSISSEASLMIYQYPSILLPKNTTQWSSQVWNPDLSTQSTVHYPLRHPTPVDNADDGLNQKHS